MPLQRCTKNGQSGWKWGQQGKCYIGKNSKQKAIAQAIAIGGGKIPIDHMDNAQTRETFKEILTQRRMQLSSRKRKSKLKQNPVWLPPVAIEKKYAKYISSIMRRFTRITVKEIKPLLRDWNNEIKTVLGDVLLENNEDKELFREIIKEKIINLDAYVDELDDINDEWRELQNTIFVEDSNDLKAEIFNIAILVSIFNMKQWQKILKATLGIEYIPIENWENLIIQSFVSENVSLIKGLTDEYIKKINFAITNGFKQGVTSQELAKQLTKINKTFTTYRTNLIARDQINKLNGQLTAKRQTDAGVDWYIWRTARDERVRPNHKVMDGKLCKWSDPTVYSDDGGKTWKSRSSIGGVLLHPGQDIQCRCFSEPYFEDIISKVDKEIERMVA